MSGPNAAPPALSSGLSCSDTSSSSSSASSASAAASGARPVTPFPTAAHLQPSALLQDEFALGSTELGALTSARVGHDGAARGAEWGLERIVVAT